MVEIARERIVYYQASAEKLPIKDACSDVVLAFDSYDHWQDQAQGLKEVRRVLKPDGLFVVVKDGGLPNITNAKKEFLSGLLDAGY